MAFRRTGSAQPSAAVFVAVLFSIATGATAATSACSLAFPADAPQCSADRDCTGRGSAFAGSVCKANVCVAPAKTPRSDARSDAPNDATHDATRDAAQDATGDAAADATSIALNDWSCLGYVTYPDASFGRMRLTIPYTDYLSGTPLVGLRVQPCERVDPTCGTPLTDAGFTNDAGIVSFLLPTGYHGYVLSSWDAGLLDRMYIDPPLFAPELEPVQGLLTRGSLALLASAIGKVDGSAVMLNPADGLLFLGTRDCKGALASGVSFSLAPASSSALVIYITEGVPSLTATSTDVGGAAAIINVPPGTVTVTATLAATGQRIGSVDGYCEANSISGFSLVPSPPDP